MKDYKQYNDRSIYVTGSLVTAMSGALVFYFKYFSIKMFGNDWFKRKGKDTRINLDTFYVFYYLLLDGQTTYYHRTDRRI